MIVCFEGIDGSGKSTQARELVGALNELCLANNKRIIAAYFSITDYAKHVAKYKNPEELSYTKCNTIFDTDTVNSLIDRKRIISICERIDTILMLLTLNNEYGKGQRYLFDQLATHYLELARELFNVFSTYDSQNYVIVLDRWLWSTIAYNAANEGCVFEELLSTEFNHGSINILKDLMYKIYKPDLLFYLDAELDQAEAARLNRGETELVLENSDYQNRVKANYSKILSKISDSDNVNKYMIYPKVIHTIKVGNRTIKDIHSEVIKVARAARI